MQGTEFTGESLEMFLLSLPSVLLLPPFHCVFETGSHCTADWLEFADKQGWCPTCSGAPTSAGGTGVLYQSWLSSFLNRRQYFFLLSKTFIMTMNKIYSQVLIKVKEFAHLFY